MRWDWIRAAAALVAALGAGSGLAAAQPVADNTLNWAFGGTVHAVARAGNVVYVGGDFQGVARRRNATGGLAVLAPDTSRRAVRTPRVHGNVNGIVDDGAGGWFVGGNFTYVGGAWRPQLAHLRADGTLDLSWTGRVNGRVYALARVGGTLYVGGEFTLAGSGLGATLPAPRLNLAAFDAATGALLPALATGADGAVSVLAAQGTTLYAGGEFATFEGQARTRLAAIDTASSTVLPWNPAPDDAPIALAPRPAGTSVFVGGAFTTIGGESRAYVAEIDATTGLATPWNPGAGDRVHALALSGSTLYVGGTFTTLAGAARNHAGAVSADTGAINAWDPNADDTVHALAVTDAVVYLGGRFTNVAGRVRLHAAAVDHTTGVPNAFHPAVNDPVRTLLADGDTVALGGAFEAIGGYARRNLAAINLETGALLPWNPRTNGPVHALAIGGDGRLYVGGAFTAADQQVRARLAAFDLATRTLTSWNPGADAPVRTLLARTEAGVTTIYAGGDFTLLGGQPRARLGAIDALSGATVAAFAPGVLDDAVLALSGDATHLYVAGRFSTVGGAALPYLARVDRTTGVADPTWAPAPDGPVRALARTGTLLYAGGAFDAIAGVARSHVAALTTSAPVSATEWQPNPDRAVNAVAPRGAVVFLGGDFSRVRGTLRPRLAMVSAGATGSGPYLLPWRPRWYGRVLAIHAAADGVVAAGEALPDLDDQEPEPVGRAAFYPQAGAGLPAPPSDAGVELHRRGLTITWGPPMRGPRPLRYLLEAGTAPGLRNLVAGADLGDATEATFTGVPPGVYFLRVRSVTAAGVSAPGPEIVVAVGVVGCGAPPEAPGALGATVANGIVTLDWDASPSPGVLGYRLEVGPASGQTSIELPVGAQTTSFSSPAPAGRYVVRVVAVSACGESAPSNEVTVDVGSGAQPPAAATDVTAEVTGNVVQVAWQPAATGTPATTYVLQAGSAPGLSDLGRLPVAGTSVAFAGVPPGTYYLRVVSVNVAGAGAPSDELVLVVQ